MKAIYGLFPDPESAQCAVDELRRTGVDHASITVITSQPFEEYEFSHRDKRTWLFWIAAGGGVLGLGAGLILAYVTETFWPIVTGGMPIFAWWPNIIVLFELTMLGAIIATVLSLLITTELPTRKVKLYDPAVSQGKILVAVEEPPDDALPKLQRVLREAKTVR
jgi:hypothetical protein